MQYRQKTLPQEIRGLSLLYGQAYTQCALSSAITVIARISYAYWLLRTAYCDRNRLLRNNSGKSEPIRTKIHAVMLAQVGLTSGNLICPESNVSNIAVGTVCCPDFLSGIQRRICSTLSRMHATTSQRQITVLLRNIFSVSHVASRA